MGMTTARAFSSLAGQHARRQQVAVALPVETRSGIGLAAGGDVAVADDAVEGDGGKAGQNGSADLGQDLILAVLIGDLVGPLQLDADGEIVAALATLERGDPGMPGALGEVDVLDQFAITADQQMAREAG